MAIGGLTRARRSAFFSFFFFAVLVGCGCSSWRYEPGWRYTSDSDAVEGRALLEHSVKITRIGGLFGEELSRASGSGTVVSVSDGPTSLILTAQHVCHVTKPGKYFGGLVEVFSSRLEVLSVKGEKFSGEVVLEDPGEDLCLVRVRGVAGVPAELADGMPPVQGRVVYSGAATGTFGRHLGTVIDGRYSGLELLKRPDGVEKWQGALSMAGSPGASGGGVYYRGRIFGVANWGYMPTGNLMWCVPVDRFSKFLSEALEAAKKLPFLPLSSEDPAPADGGACSSGTDGGCSGEIR